VANKEYIERLQMVIRQLHQCEPRHVESVPVQEIFNGQTIWGGVVEVFVVTGHPKAKRAFAWSHRAGKGDTNERFVAVLEIPPVTSPETAVRVVIGQKSKAKSDRPGIMTQNLKELIERSRLNIRDSKRVIRENTKLRAQARRLARKGKAER